MTSSRYCGCRCCGRPGPGRCWIVSSCSIARLQTAESRAVVADAGYCSARCSRCSGPLGVGDRGGGREHTATPELASAQTAASSRHAAPPLTPALCISLSTSSRTACNSSPRSSRPRSKPRCLARSTSCAAPLGRHFPHLGAGVWPGGGDRVQRADGLVKVAADRSRSRRRSARIAAPSSTALGRGGAHGAPRVEAPLGSFAQPGVAQGVLWAKILGSIRVSQRYFGAFRCFSWVI